jgi:DNA-binding NarL/FixJ family response regulator
MSNPLVDNARQMPRVTTRWQPRIAVGLEDEREQESFILLLATVGLPVNAGAVGLRRIGELVADPPDALVLAGNPRRPELLAALRRARRQAPESRIVIVATGDDQSSLLARSALNAGADAFVPPGAADGALAAAVHAVLAGMVCVPREARRLVAKPTFSHREKEVLALVVAGLSNREIAGRLFLAESTVKSHLISAFAKLGVRSRKDAAAILLDPAEGLAATALAPAPDTCA